MKKSINFHMQSIWAYQPMSRLVISFALGCLIGNFQFFSVIPLSSICLVFLLNFFGLISFSFIKNTRLRKFISSYLLGIFIHFIFLTAGVISVFQTQVPKLKSESKFERNFKSQAYIIQITDDPRYKTNLVSFDCNLIELSKRNQNHSVFQKVRVQISNILNHQFEINDRFIVWGKLKSIQAPNVPGEFDYKSFLAQRGIFSQLKINEQQLFRLSNAELTFKRVTNSWRSKLLSQLDDSIFNPDEKQVASALLLGDRSEMNSDLIKNYSAGGIIHILAVSGLHVGLIFQALTFLFGFIPFLKKGKMNIFLILLILWVYAAMTGLSPSVNRAVCMFTLIMVSNLLNRSVSPFNILSGAAFILLIISPHVIIDIGFQLSFIAVWAILTIRPILDSIQKIPNRLFRNILVPIAISTAAQIATSPITFFVFGTFPTWFLPSNLIAVPLSTLLTYIGILTLFIAKIPLLGIGCMYLFSHGIGLLNKWAIFIGTLPYAKIDQLTISIGQLFFYSASIWFAFVLVKHISVRYLYAFFITFCFGLILGILNDTLLAEKPQNFIYSNNNSIHFHKSNNQHYVLFKGEHYFHFPSKYHLNIPRTLNPSNDLTVVPIIVEMLHSNYRLKNETESKALNLNRLSTKNGFYKMNNVLLINTATKNSFTLLESENQTELILLFSPWLRKKDRIPFELVAKRKHWICYDPFHDGYINY